MDCVRQFEELMGYSKLHTVEYSIQSIRTFLFDSTHSKHELRTFRGEDGQKIFFFLTKLPINMVPI